MGYTSDQVMKVRDDIGSVQEDITDIKEDLASVNTEIDNIKEDIRDITSDVARDHSALLTLSASYNVAGIQKNLLFDSYKIQMDILGSEVFFAPPKWSESDEIAKDFKSDKVFTASELANRPNLFVYEQNGREVYFLGQYI